MLRSAVLAVSLIGAITLGWSPATALAREEPAPEPGAGSEPAGGPPVVDDAGLLGQRLPLTLVDAGLVLTGVAVAAGSGAVALWHPALGRRHQTRRVVDGATTAV